MFKKTTICPNPMNANNQTCKGFRVNGTLKNACAACDAYKAYVKESVPNKK